MAFSRSRKPLLYSTELSENIGLTGDLRTRRTLLVKGRFSGSIASSSHVTIGKGAVANFNSLAAESISIAGKASGLIKAASCIEISNRAEVRADMEAPTIEISEMSRFEGSVKMPGIQGEWSPFFDHS